MTTENYPTPPECGYAWCRWTILTRPKSEPAALSEVLMISGILW